MNRKFQHYAVGLYLISLSTLFVIGFLNVVFHIAFNNPSITFGGW